MPTLTNYNVRLDINNTSEYIGTQTYTLGTLQGVGINVARRVKRY